MAKQNALQKIESHEKLCRIMQKLTHKKIHHSNMEMAKMIWGYRILIIAAIAYLYYIHYLECI